MNAFPTYSPTRRTADRKRGTPHCQATRIRRVDGDEPIRQWLESHARQSQPEYAGRVEVTRGPLRSPPANEAPAPCGRRGKAAGRGGRVRTRPTSRHQTSVRKPLLQWTDRALLVLGILLMALLLLRIETAQAVAAPTPGEGDAWGLAFDSGGHSWRSVAVNTEIEADITGLLARVDVRQRFSNTGTDWAEAVYRFPLPDGAAVDELLVQVGDRTIQGEIREREPARRQYQAARAQGRVASLVEQQPGNRFEVRIANVGPGEDIVVSISFLASVAFLDDTYSLRLPLTFTPRWTPAESADAADITAAAMDLDGGADHADDRYLAMNIRLNSGLALARIESRYHDMAVHPGADGYHLVLVDPDTRTDRVFQLDWAPDFAATPQSVLTTWDGGDAVYAMLMLAPPLREALAPQPREVVFVIDTSGSMEGQSLQQAQAGLLQGLQQLAAHDRFNLIQFNSDSERLFGESQPVNPRNLDRAGRFVRSLNASGGTNMAPALRDALGLAEQPGLLRQVIFMTDGSVGNEAELLQQIAAQVGASRLFTVSIGSAPNSGFMRKAAAIGRGSHTSIGTTGEVEERISALWSRIQQPALQDICIDWGTEAEFYPERVPDLYAGEPLWLHARLPLEPRDVTLCGTLDGQPWETVVRPLRGPGSRNLATLWARSKIEALQDDRLLGHGDDELVRLEVTALGLEHGLLTPYTSLVAVDRTPARPADAALTSQRIASLLPAGSAGLSAGFAATATGWLTQLLLSLITLLTAVAMMWFSIPPRRRPPADHAVPTPAAAPTSVAKIQANHLDDRLASSDRRDHEFSHGSASLACRQAGCRPR